jgi:putative transposase
MEISTNPGRRKAQCSARDPKEHLSWPCQPAPAWLLSAAQVDAVASGLGVTGRTVWRWLASAAEQDRAVRKPRAHFELSDRISPTLPTTSATWPHSIESGCKPGRRGRASAPCAPGGGSPAVARRRAGLSRGERARRDHDTYLTRKAGFRSECWEADHTELAVRARLRDGSVVRPWLTDVRRPVHAGRWRALLAVTPRLPTVGLPAGLGALDVALSSRSAARAVGR